jgi:hypothetical protein
MRFSGVIWGSGSKAKIQIMYAQKVNGPKINKDIKVTALTANGLTSK